MNPCTLCLFYSAGFFSLNLFVAIVVLCPNLWWVLLYGFAFVFHKKQKIKWNWSVQEICNRPRIDRGCCYIFYDRTRLEWVVPAMKIFVILFLMLSLCSFVVFCYFLILIFSLFCFNFSLIVLTLFLFHFRVCMRLVSLFDVFRLRKSCCIVKRGIKP